MDVDAAVAPDSVFDLPNIGEDSGGRVSGENRPGHSHHLSGDSGIGDEVSTGASRRLKRQQQQQQQQLLLQQQRWRRRTRSQDDEYKSPSAANAANEERRSTVGSLGSEFRSLFRTGAIGLGRFGASYRLPSRRNTRRSQSIAEEGEYHCESTNTGSEAGDGSTGSPDRPRRNSDQGQGRVRIVAPATASNSGGGGGGGSGSSSNRRSTVKQFFDNFRPRAKSESAHSIARPTGRHQGSSAESAAAPDIKTAVPAAAAAAAAAAAVNGDNSAGLGTIRQGEEFVGHSGGGGGASKKRSRSPLGLVNRLRHLTTTTTGAAAASGADSSATAQQQGGGDPGRYRRRSGAGGAAAVAMQSLPHPSEMPLDCAHHDDVCTDRRNRMRKNSFPPQAGNIQERHRDLFENLSHSADVEGQCSILSPAAVAESQARSRRLSGPVLLHLPLGVASPSGVAAAAAGAAAASVNFSSSSVGGANSELGCCGRRRALSGAGPSAAVAPDVQVTENDKYIIFKSKCQKSDSAAANLDDVQSELAALGDAGPVFEIFARHHTCYDLIPTSSKLLVFDNNLNVRKAFFALVYNGLRAAPLWDSGRQKFVGMLTVTDFIHILHKYYRSALVPMEVLETHRISTWQAELSSQLKPLIWISPEASIYDAVRVLLRSRVHRLPVIDPRTGNALFIVTHKRVLKFICLYAHQLPMPHWLGKTIKELNIGTYAGIVTVGEATPLVRVLTLFVQHRISALPVLDSDGRLSDIYSKFDVINLAATKTYNNLDIFVGEALQYRRERFEGVSSCKSDASLKSVIDQLVSAEVHRLVIVDDDNRVTGMVSLSDILNALVIDYDRLRDVTVRESFETGL